ncbi:hypothetical protein IF2G_10636 [Cordyceps javanica]|nr:hypothetical protein IF2G_10636 [Cordyceps javanica]
MYAIRSYKRETRRHFIYSTVVQKGKEEEKITSISLRKKRVGENQKGPAIHTPPSPPPPPSSPVVVVVVVVLQATTAALWSGHSISTATALFSSSSLLVVVFDCPLALSFPPLSPATMGTPMNLCRARSGGMDG